MEENGRVSSREYVDLEDGLWRECKSSDYLVVGTLGLSGRIRTGRWHSSGKRDGGGL